MIKMTVNTKQEAWEKASELFPTGYEKDIEASERAGYDIYKHPSLDGYNRICDLGNRLEILTGKYGETVTNIWIAEADREKSEAAAPGYGERLAEEIKASKTDCSDMSEFEKFVLNAGWKYDAKEALQAGYDRAWKCARNIMLTEDEFIAEAEAGKCCNADTLKEVYAKLFGLVKAEKLSCSDIYRYARYKWCLHDPEAIIAYRGECDKWMVNNCCKAVSEEEAKIAINNEWGFEASRLTIIGVPYYDSTDWQFIRFNCAGTAWLWFDEDLRRVYE